MFLTEIARDFRGDARFPPFERSQWRERAREAHVDSDGMRFDFVTYERA
jgi:dihydrofolate reductase